MIDRVAAAVAAAGQLARDFLAALFPPELRQYVPGRKLIAGAVTYVLVELLGLPPEASVEIPGLALELNAEALAALAAVYLWPEEIPRRRRRRRPA